LFKILWTKLQKEKKKENRIKKKIGKIGKITNQKMQTRKGIHILPAE
jgi:hypothetical protein